MNYKSLVLVVEDEPSASNFISAALRINEYKVIHADTGSCALSMIPSHCPDIILLDLGLPDMHGLDIIRTVRGWTATPILVVSSCNEESMKVRALDLGADDYITKPFGSAELLARIRVAMRHHVKFPNSNTDLKGTWVNRGLRIDFDRYLVTVDNLDVHLTQNEFKIVALLAAHCGQVLDYSFIVNHVWGHFAPNDRQILRVNMANIRRKIEKDPAHPCYIVTEVGVGYRMREASSKIQTPA